MTPDPAILAEAMAINRPRLMAVAEALHDAADDTGLSEKAKTARAFFSLAKTQRRLAGEYRVWAREADARGDYPRYVRYAAEARRLFRDARCNLQSARQWSG